MATRKLYISAIEGDITNVKHLFQINTNPNITDYHKLNAIHYCCFNHLFCDAQNEQQNFDMISCLTNNGTDPNAISILGNTALHLVSISARISYLKMVQCRNSNLPSDTTNLIQHINPINGSFLNRQKTGYVMNQTDAINRKIRRLVKFLADNTDAKMIPDFNGITPIILYKVKNLHVRSNKILWIYGSLTISIGDLIELELLEVLSYLQVMSSNYKLTSCLKMSVKHGIKNCITYPDSESTVHNSSQDIIQHLIHRGCRLTSIVSLLFKEYFQKEKQIKPYLCSLNNKWNSKRPIELDGFI